MAPEALLSARLDRKISNSRFVCAASTLRKCLFTRISNNPPSLVSKGVGNEFFLPDGTSIFDASGGAAVTCLGRYDARVMDAIVKEEEKGLAYLPAEFYAQVSEDLARKLIETTDGMMRHVEFYGSGSDANEAGMKVARQYHAKAKKNPEQTRRLFISRDRSYHGSTLAALDLGGHKARRELYDAMLARKGFNVSPCYPYRDLRAGETVRAYVQRLGNELEAKIQELGAENVAGFIVEPVVGAALGCVAAVDGYLEKMREICDRHDILLIFDEVMCGVGRTGYFNAWQKSGVVPDVQLIGKGLGSGHVEISAMLVGDKIADAFARTGETFAHGHTFRNKPAGCAGALKTLQIIQDDGLLENVRGMGNLLEKKLKESLGDHPNVGDIRGEGHFWAIEFVMDRTTKEPFDSKCDVSTRIQRMGLTKKYGIHVYPGAGTANGINGDHIIISPAYNITEKDVDIIVNRTTKLIEHFFEGLNGSTD